MLRYLAERDNINIGFLKFEKLMLTLGNLSF